MIASKFDRKIPAFVFAAVLAASPALSSELKIGNAGDMRSGIPAGNTDPNTINPQLQVYEGLLTSKENGAIAPMLAADLPKISDDGLVYTFDLRKDVWFHDGTPLTAQAAAKSWKYLLNPKNSWPCRSYFDGSGKVKVTDIEATDPLTMTIKLAKPAPELLVQMARSDCIEGAIMSEAITDSPEKPTKPIGTGPYKIDSIRPGQDVTLVKFDKYAPRSEPMDGLSGKKEALIDKLIFVTIPDPAATNSALLAGGIDVWPRIELSYLKDLEKRKGMVVDSATTPSIYTLAMQTSRGPLQNAALRKAVDYAIDRKSMVDALTESRAIATGTIIPASSPFYNKAMESTFQYDPDKARKFLAEAGYKGERVRVTTNKNYAIMFETGVMIQAFLQAVGINADLEVVDFASQLPRYFSGDYDLITWNYTPTLNPALIIDRATGSKEASPSKIWTNPEARAVVDDILKSPIEKQQPLYDKLNGLFLADAPMLVWASGEVTSAYSSKVKGYRAWAGRTPRFWGVSIGK